MSACEGCGVAIEQPAFGRRKWCDESCRRRHMYGGQCVDCAAPTSRGHGTAASPRCRVCAGKVRRVWTREVMVDRIREWAEAEGNPPAAFDWNPAQAARRGLPATAQRFREAAGHWPYAAEVQRMFGSWNAGIEAAGFTPRRPGQHGRARTVR